MLRGLSPDLTYHNFDHTCMVVESSLNIARNENITSPEELTLLEAAAWLHDTGFLRTYHEHEIASCAIAREILPEAGASESEIEAICQLIMSTRLPQQPVNKLGFIICDADLDYLGGDLFDPISQQLKNEWINFGMITDESKFLQSEIYFLSQHRYFTQFSQTHREPVKKMHLKNLMMMVRQRLTA